VFGVNDLAKGNPTFILSPILITPKSFS